MPSSGSSSPGHSPNNTLQSKRVQFGAPRPFILRTSHPSPAELPPEDKESSNYVRRASKSLDLIKREDGVNEHSPLLAPRRSQDVGDLPPLSTITSPEDEDWHEERDHMQETKSSWYLFLMTFCLGGLQIAWSVELSNGSPYLLGLGISKSLLAFVWIAGPLSGTLVQPYVGIKSDRCRSRWGKRRPFMVFGALATIVSLMALAWARELIYGLMHGIFRIDAKSEAIITVTIIFAVLMIYVLDFSINVIQAAMRAFFVDCAPPHQQDAANAWASRMSGVGNIVGYLFGYIDLPKYFWFFGDTQFKVLCVIASVTMAGTLAVSALSVQERDPRFEGEPAKEVGGVLAFFTGLWRSMRKLPLQISLVCQVQLAAWIGWFPFLFYITTYIGEIYVDPYFVENPHLDPSEVDRIWEEGTRMGTFALLVFAVTTFASSVFLPFIVASSYRPPEPQPRTPMTPGARGPATPTTPRTPGGATAASGYFGYASGHLSTAPNTPHTPGGAAVGSSYFGFRSGAHHDDYFGSAVAPRQKSKYMRLFRLRSIEIPWLTLRRAWLLSHVLFALLTFATFFIRSVWAATALVGLIGVPWAMTNWAPYALIAAEVGKRDAIRRGAIRPPPTRDGQLLAHGEDPAEGADQAGVVLGIHNVAIAAPQVVATLVSSVIFRALQKPRGEPGDDSVAWVLRFGGVAALGAAVLCRRVMEEGDERAG